MGRRRRRGRKRGEWMEILRVSQFTIEGGRERERDTKSLLYMER